MGLTSLARKDLMPEMVHKLGTLLPHVQWTPAPPKALPAPRAELQAAPAAAPAAAELLALPAPAGEPAAPAPVETAAATRSKRQRTTQNASAPRERTEDENCSDPSCAAGHGPACGAHAARQNHEGGAWGLDLWTSHCALRARLEGLWSAHLCEALVRDCVGVRRRAALR